MKNYLGTSYVDKLFTHPNYQGNGLAFQLLERISSDSDGFMFRTSDEGIKNFYEKVIEKFKKNGLKKEGRTSTVAKVGDYWVFGINMQADKYYGLLPLIAIEPPSLVHSKNS